MTDSDKEIQPLSMDEIKDKLIKMEVGINGVLPVKFFGFIVKNPEYDPDNFSQEIEDSEIEVDIFNEINKKINEPDFDFIWNNTLDNIQLNSEQWKKNHIKKCQATFLHNRFAAQCIEHPDGIRNYYSEEIIDMIQEVLDEYKEIYDFC